MDRISTRSISLGRSTKNSSSKRPRRSSSGGSAVTSFAVATTNTGASFSASQVRKAPNTRLAARVRGRSRRSPSRSRRSRAPPARATRPPRWPRAWSPRGCAQRSPKAAARSRRSSGKRHSRATALAESDLPQPCTPSSRRPRGAGSPKLARLVAEGAAPLAQPALQLAEAADLREVVAAASVEARAPACGAAPSASRAPPVRGRPSSKAPAASQRLAEHAHRLGAGEPERRAHAVVERVARRRGAAARARPRLLEQRRSSSAVGSGSVTRLGLALELERQVEHRADQDERLAARCASARQRVAQAAHRERVARARACASSSASTRRLLERLERAQAGVERARARRRRRAAARATRPRSARSQACAARARARAARAPPRSSRAPPAR